MISRPTLRIYALGMIAFLGCKTTGNSSAVKDDDAGGVAPAATNTYLCGNSGPGVPDFHLTACAGQFSFMTLMATNPGGIKSLIDADGVRQLTVPTSDVVTQKQGLFATNVVSNVNDVFTDKQGGLSTLVGKINGQTTTSLNIHSIIQPALGSTARPAALAAVMVAPFLTIASGGGAHVWLDANTHYLNVGYGPGTDPHDVKTGRSFGMSRTRGARDTSDTDYLTDLGTYLPTDSAAAYFQTIFQLLGKSDGSGIAALSDTGQTLIADFMAVFTAEADRNLMSNLQGHFWENDLAEATWVSGYVVSSGMIVKNIAGKQCSGYTDSDSCTNDANSECAWANNRCYTMGGQCSTFKTQDTCPTTDPTTLCGWTNDRCSAAHSLPDRDVFTTGKPTDFFAIGPTGSGIGDAKYERRGLQAAISKYEWSKADNSAIANLAQAIGANQGDDVYMKLADTLAVNHAGSDVATVLAAGTQLVQNSDQITALATAFMVQVQADASAITQAIAASAQWPTP